MTANRRLFTGTRAATLAAIAMAVLVVAACGETASAPSNASATPPCVGCSVDGKTTPRTADGHPDLNGYWSGAPPNPNAAAGGNAGGGGGRVMNRYADGSIIFDFSTEYNEENGVGRICISDDCQAPNQPPYNAEWMAKVKEIAKTQFGGTTALDPAHDCRPAGVPRAGINNVHILQTAHAVAVLYEGAPYSTYRLIYTDGRQHPEDLETTFWGHSIGRWEGDTLVVDVVGLTEETWVGGGGATGRNAYTSIHSDQMHVVERWTRDGDVLTYEATVEDPVAFTKPWVITPRRVRHAGPDEEIYENICTANFKDHFVAPSADDPDIKSRCGYRCEDDAPSADAEPPAANITGAWEVTTKFLDRTATERWQFQQKGNAVTAAAMGERGTLPVSGSIEGAFVRVTAKDGDKEYKIRATVDGDAMDGSITLGVGQQFLWHAKRTK
jgi:hypothetical protein